MKIKSWQWRNWVFVFEPYVQALKKDKRLLVHRNWHRIKKTFTDRFSSQKKIKFDSLHIINAHQIARSVKVDLQFLIAEQKTK